LKQVLEELGDAEQRKRQVETLNAELRYDRSKIEDDLIRLERDLENTREEIYGLKARLAVYGWSSALRDS
jgi:phage shock protein A